MKNFDVIILGAGAGGLCAGALLASTGKVRVLLLEQLPFVGGRFSSLVHKGYTLSTGAVSIEGKGPLEEIFNTLGIPFDPDSCWDDRKQIYRMSSKIIDSRSITQTARGAKDGRWTTVIAAAVFLVE